MNARDIRKSGLWVTNISTMGTKMAHAGRKVAFNIIIKIKAFG
jgi:hypothetical protein